MKLQTFERDSYFYIIRLYLYTGSCLENQTVMIKFRLYMVSLETQVNECRAIENLGSAYISDVIGSFLCYFLKIESSIEIKKLKNMF